MVEYIFDVDYCRSQGRVYWINTQLWSLIPFSGFSSFNIGKRLDGAIKLFRGFVSGILCAARNDALSHKSVEDDGFGACMAFFVLAVDMLKIVWDYFTEKEALSELIIVAIAVVISLITLAIIPKNKVHCIGATLALVVSLGLLEWIKHIFMIYYNIELDINGCPLL